jgi:hypothetical protein
MNIHAEVDGLYAGINLLNELEPDDIDDDESDSDGSDMDEEDDDRSNHDTDSQQTGPQHWYQGPSPASMWANLADEIKRINPWVNLKIPMDFRRYIEQLQISSGGVFTCRSCSPFKDDSFFGSRQAIRLHFLTNHCDIGFICYDRERTLDILQWLMEQPYIESRISDMHARFRHEPLPPSPHAIQKPYLQLYKSRRPKIFRDETKVLQWQSLRKVRTNFKSFHRRFLKACKSSDQPALKRFGKKKCRRWKGLLNTSILTLRGILRDRPPASLKEVFAFIALSCALKQSGSAKSSEYCPSESDLLAWKSGVTDSKDRSLFVMLLSLLWPEIQPNLLQLDLPEPSETPNNTLPRRIFRFSDGSELNLPEPSETPNNTLPRHIFRFSDGSNLPLHLPKAMELLSHFPKATKSPLCSAAEELMKESASESKFHELLDPGYLTFANEEEDSSCGRPSDSHHANWPNTERSFLLTPAKSSGKGYSSDRLPSGQGAPSTTFEGESPRPISFSQKVNSPDRRSSTSNAHVQLIQVLKATIIFITVYCFIICKSSSP